jgi:hypothetical protein
VRRSARTEEGNELHLYKRSELAHHSTAELIVMATRIANAKGRVKRIPDLAWIVIASDKNKLITYVASNGESSDGVPVVRNIKPWRNS